MASYEKLIIRVYGILLDEVKGVLVADEFQHGMRFSKFPGGGLELGEGTIDCLKREWKEELGQQIEVIEHIYTTDFLQPSAFNPRHQVISIYYRVKALNDPLVQISDTPFDYKEEKDGAESFRWISLKDFHEDEITLPIDKLVARKIRENFKMHI